MRPALAIIGAGGFAAEAAEAALCAGWPAVEFFDDDPAKQGQAVIGWPVRGTIDEFEKGPNRAFALGIGNNSIREKLDQRLAAAGHQATTIVHPTCVVSRTAALGPGTFLAPFVWIGPNVTIGRHALLNVGATVGHDATLGNWVQLCPGTRVSGFCWLGDGAFMGSNSVLAPKVTLERGARLGAASFAWRSVPAGGLAVGNPARLVETP